MNDQERTRVSEPVVKCTASLFQAINDAGGRPDTSKILAMTMTDFITHIAGINNIRFFYDKPESIDYSNESVDTSRCGRCVSFRLLFAEMGRGSCVHPESKIPKGNSVSDRGVCPLYERKTQGETDGHSESDASGSD